MTMPMVKGASVSDRALRDITGLLEKGKLELRENIHRFIDKVKGPDKGKGEEEETQSDFTILKLRFNSILDDLDIFADVLSQRAEYDVGVWTSGLDVLAE